MYVDYTLLWLNMLTLDPGGGAPVGPVYLPTQPSLTCDWGDNKGLKPNDQELEMRDDETTPYEEMEDGDEPQQE